MFDILNKGFTLQSNHFRNGKVIFEKRNQKYSIRAYNKNEDCVINISTQSYDDAKNRYLNVCNFLLIRPKFH